MNILLKSATIVDSDSPYHLKIQDVLIENGMISKIGSSLKAESNTSVVKLDNLHISRGWFDSSVQFGEPGYEERETLENGLMTAAQSGFTDIGLQSDLIPVTDTHSQVSYLKSKTKNFATNLHPFGALTKLNQQRELAELFDMHKAGAVAFYDYKKSIDNAYLLKLALQYAQSFGGLVCSFPNDGNLSGEGVMHEGGTSTKLGLAGIPVLAETLRVARDLQILEYTGGKLHIPTVSCEETVALIAKAKDKGLDVTCSISVNNLALTDEVLFDFDSNKKVLPPLRDEANRQAMVKAIKKGLIDLVTSDHCPIDIEHKKMEFDHAAFGSTGLESSFGILNRIFGLERTIALLTGGKNRFGIKNLAILPGNEARLSLFNPEGNSLFTVDNILSSAKNSALVSEKLKGKTYGIFSNNQLIIK